MIVRGNDSEFEQPAIGSHRAICVNVFDIGMQKGFHDGEFKRKVIILWELEEKRKKGMFAGKPFLMHRIYTASLNRKSNLLLNLESWRGKPFSDSQKQAFDLDCIKGVPCVIKLVGNGDYAKIDNVLPPDKSRPYWAQETPKDFIPPFVKNYIDQQIKSDTPEEEPTEAVEYKEFNDEIPF